MINLIICSYTDVHAYIIQPVLIWESSCTKGLPDFSQVYGALMPPILGLKQISELFGYPFEIHYLVADPE